MTCWCSFWGHGHKQDGKSAQSFFGGYVPDWIALPTISKFGVPGEPISTSASPEID